MSTLEYTVLMLKTMPEETLKEVQNYIQYLLFRDAGTVAMELLNEDDIVDKLTKSIEMSDGGATTPASEVAEQMRKKYAI